MADFNDMADIAVKQAEQIVQQAAVQSGNPQAAEQAMREYHQAMQTQKMPPNAQPQGPVMQINTTQHMPPNVQPQMQQQQARPQQQGQPQPQPRPQQGPSNVKAGPAPTQKAYGPTGSGFSYFHEDPNRSGWFSKGNSKAQSNAALGKDIGLIISIAMVIAAAVGVWVLGAHTSIDYLISKGYKFLDTSPWSIGVWFALGGISAFEIRFCPISWRGLWHISLAKPQDGIDTVILVLWFVIAGIDVGTNQQFVSKLMNDKLEITLFGPDFVITGWLLGVVIMSVSFLIAFVTEPMIRKLWPRFIHALKA